MSKILLSMPVLGRPELRTMQSLMQAISCCKNHQIKLHFNENDSLISRVRNVHISDFIDRFKDCDYFMSLDSDLEIINAYHNNNIFNKLIDCDKDFVGGLYAKKRAGIPESSSVSINHETTFDFDSGLKEMLWLSSGCWMIKRSAIEKMVEEYQELHYDGDDNASNKKIYGLYIPMLLDFKKNNGENGKKYLSEDWSFASRWRAIGGQIWADTSIVLNHLGTYPYALWQTKVEAIEIKKEAVKETSFCPPPAGFNLK